MSLRVAVIGAGRMGKLHSRVLSQMPQVQLACVADQDLAVAQAVAAPYGCPAVASAEQAVELADAAIIAVPTVNHVAAALPFVRAGKGVLIEKPIAPTSAAAEELLALAEQTGASVQVGHTERFNPVAEAVRRFQIAPRFIEAHRISPFTFRSADVGVVLDMMIHDIDLVLSMTGCEPVSVEAVGVNVLSNHEDIANARVTFANGCVANLTASRLAVKSERKMRIFSQESYVSVDYGKKVGIVVKKSANLNLLEMFQSIPSGDLAELAGKVLYTDLLKIEQLQVDDGAEPLRKQAEAFVRSIVERTEPIVTGRAGLAAVRCAESIVKAIQDHRWTL
jgi:predicted dehydrogenase